ncbi:interferon alpha-6-like [Alexandromys fortis]|uniref:interferon alpha-6-like n=1 Tax=Alexandromys fortis TaxID=100897 RepID=UPI002152C34B|nr:interferon alpha-6-like [Microtus fortis]
MKIMPVLSCLQDRTDFKCPWKKGHIIQGKQREVATCCYSEMLRQVLQLFRPRATRDAWPERTLGRLLTSLLSGLEALEGSAEQTPPCLPTLAMAIRIYFLRISRYLEGKGYSPCSWEIVRAEMQVALSTFPVPAERTSRKRRSSMQESPLRMISHISCVFHSNYRFILWTFSEYGKHQPGPTLKIASLDIDPPSDSAAARVQAILLCPVQ